MSKIQKIAILCLIILIGSIAITTLANAEEAMVTKYISYDDLCNNENLLCAQHYQDMYGANYNLVATINITGNKSTGNNVTVENWHNAKLASILSNPRGEADPITNVEDLPVQNAIWNYLKTWCAEVGEQHNSIIGTDFTNNADGNYSTQIEEDAKIYADNYKEGSLEDKTSKDKIKVTQYSEENQNYLRVGPFKYEFTGTLKDIKVLTNKNIELELKSFEECIKEGEYSKIQEIKSGEEFYISVKMPTDGSDEITKVMLKNETTVKHVEIKFWEHVEQSEQNLLEYTYNDEQISLEKTLSYEIKLKGDLTVIKVDAKNNEIKLPGVGFYIKNEDTSKYIQETNGTITYVSSKEEATEFITDRNGKIEVKDLIVGDYEAIETKNPHYGYEIIKEGQRKEVVVDKTEELQIPNTQTYIKLSGYVWVDNIAGKQSTRNDLYNNDNNENDILLDGVTVRLKDRETGEIVLNKDGTKMETKTSNGGKYLFVDVLIENLDKYYVEFEYDGLTYTNVVPHIDKDNGSKAAENINVRDEFNKDFSVVEGKTKETGITRDSEGSEKYSLNYNLDKNAFTATLNNTGLYLINSNTDETKYSIKDAYDLELEKAEKVEEIKNINLGLYEREQPDISLVKDLQNLKLSINGYNNIYEYGLRYVHEDSIKPTDDDLNVGVKYKNEFTGSYNRAIYKADYIYNDEKPKEDSKNLKAYLTYKIKLINETTKLSVKVNSIVDYFDNNYELVKIGTGLDEVGSITGELPKENYKIEAHNSKYSKVIINNNTKIDAKGDANIYVQFELSRDAIMTLINNGETLENVAEINSYSVFDSNGKVYAGIDKDSNPGNAMLDETTIWREDDTDKAPSLQLELADGRKLKGTVFLDESTGGIGMERRGDGIFQDEGEEKEKGISGVEVTFVETTGTGLEYTATTNENGEFEITDYIPGDYTLTYTWGDKTYVKGDNLNININVNDYKGTIYKDRANNNKEWYKTTNPRYSDAIDDYSIREAIDNEMKNITYNTTTTIKEMKSTTPTNMGIEIENMDTSTASAGNKYEFLISNLDFGIVERPRQNMTLSKRVKTFKLILGNGNSIADVTIDENGQITGQTKNVTYMKPSDTTIPKNGYVKLELDSELIQGAILQVGYEIKAENNSELDYLSENYYNYGIVEGEKVKITPSAIIDYLDKDWGFEAEKNKDWEVKTIEGIKDIVAETVYNNENSAINDKIILYTEILKSNQLEPGESAEVMLNVSKKLANSDEISLDNETEIVKVEKSGGSQLESTPGNYIPGIGDSESDDDMSETVIVTPNTGDNLNFIIPVMIAIISLAILAGGVVVIKKKAL